jgi:tRNA-dihydrouridine synthase 3
MALATSVLSGSKEEWSLLRRHPSESIYGVQIAGSRPATLVRAAEVFQKELGHGGSAGRNGVDFVDVNCGCPIDLVYKTGAGSARKFARQLFHCLGLTPAFYPVLDTPGKLGKILIGMNRALGDIPLTIKVRTGVREGKNTAHKLVPRLGSWGVGAFAIHGRTRQQRYSKLADWSYIKECVEALRAASTDDDCMCMSDLRFSLRFNAVTVPNIPIFGGGDVYSSEDYWTKLEQSGVDGIMIGRGALIKPWILYDSCSMIWQ